MDQIQPPAEVSGLRDSSHVVEDRSTEVSLCPRESDDDDFQGVIDAVAGEDPQDPTSV